MTDALKKAKTKERAALAAVRRSVERFANTPNEAAMLAHGSVVLTLLRRYAHTVRLTERAKEGK